MQERDRIEVIAWKKNGDSTSKIARDLGRSRWFVDSTWKRWLDLGTIDDRKRTGRPPKFNTKDRRTIVASAKGKRMRSTRSVARRFNHHRGKDISHETVRKILKESGLKPHRHQKVPKLSEKQKKSRLAFAKKYSKHDWSKTLFTDEKHFLLYPPPNSRNDVVWDEAGVSYQAEVVKHSPTVRVWGGISQRGPTDLIEYHSTVDTEQYIDILEKAQPSITRLFGNRSFCFQQDGATAHTSKRTQDWIKKNFKHFIPKEDWPGNSPDLNPIENIWAYIEKEVHAKPVRTVTQLRRRIFNAWGRLELSQLKPYIDSISDRLKQVEELNGGVVR